MPRSHGQDTNVLFNHNQITIFVDNLQIAVFEVDVFFRLAHRNFHSRLKRKIKLRDALAIHDDAFSSQRRFDFTLA